MGAIVLTNHQVNAAIYACDTLEEGAQVVAIRGLAGTGKTTLIPTLREMLSASQLDTAVGTPTHKAAVVLKQKGVHDAATIHSLAMTSYFTGDYARLMEWLGEPVPCDESEYASRTPDVDGVPYLAAQGLTRLDIGKKALLNRSARYGAHKAADSIGVRGQKFFHRFGPKQGRGVLIIDEASMVGEENLGHCTAAFPKVILIGDPGQLAPVRDKEVLSTISGFDLVEIHRQAADSPIITLAYAARRGQHNWKAIPVAEGRIESLRRMDPGACTHSPLLVWTNDLRVQLIHQIRHALGYSDASIEVGEPLMCKATDKASRAAGFVHNSHWRVVERSKHDPRRVTIQEEGASRTHDVLLHLEETDGSDIDPEAVPFRYAYSITVHTAQGSEWPTTYISHPSLLRKMGAASTRKDPEEAKRWAYTAVTRAKETLGFLTTHEFSALMQIAPTHQGKREKMPLIMQDSANDPTMTVGTPVDLPEDPGEADIPDPDVPAALIAAIVTPETVAQAELVGTIGAAIMSEPPVNGVISKLPDNMLPLAHGFCDYVQARMHAWMLEEHGLLMRGVDTSLLSIRDWAKQLFEELSKQLAQVTDQNEHSNYQLANAVETLTQNGVPLLTPYQVVLRVRSPQGVAMSLTVTKPTAALLVDDLERLSGWLQSNGYTPDDAVAVAA